MKNPSKYIYQCCTHYREKGYDDGYIMLPIFRVKVCRNCGECHAVWGTAANILFMGLFRWFWNGKVHIKDRTPLV